MYVVSPYWAACEYTYCANDCAGHGKCNFVTGVCECEANYVADQFAGCVLRTLFMVRRCRLTSA